MVDTHEKVSHMISVQDALDITLAETRRLQAEEVSLLQACGYILAEEVFSDVDMPPFEKSSMDGYAVKYVDLKKAPAVLEVVGWIPAGTHPEFTIRRGQTAKIMTGAPLPAGADSVQIVEKSEPVADGRVKLLESIAPGGNVARAAEVLKAGEKVFGAGTYVSPAVVSVLATVGKSTVKIYRRAEVGILVTGSELVEIDQKPGLAQIRNSNGYTLYHQALEAGARPQHFGVVRDDADEITEKIEAGLSKDVLLISGGVSMGDLDLVAGILKKLGVQILYHKVNVKPGKPLAFGKKGRTLVFGLPGNPVSSSTIFEIFVKPTLLKMMGFRQIHNARVKAVLAADFRHKSKRETYHPARTVCADGQFHVTPLQSKGSADVLAFAKSNSFLILPGDRPAYDRGDQVEVMLRSEVWKT
ncbi:MAG: gephyrin-like molybdotransferase Glp [bacterium]